MFDSSNDTQKRNPFDIDYRHLVENIPVIIYIAAWDEHSSTIYTSPQVERMLGFTQAEWMADSDLWFTRMHLDDRQRALDDLARIRAGGTPIPVEYRMLTRNGTVRWFRDRVAVVSHANGTPLALYGVMLDITREKELEDALNAAKNELWEARKPKLDERELDILRLLLEHHTDQEIGDSLAISERTVRNIVTRLCGKLGVTTRREALKEASRLDLLEK